MPRDSTFAPPDTRCGPRSTSPSSVAIGADVWRENDDRLLERLGDVRLGKHLLDGDRVRPLNAEDVGDRHDAGHAQRFARVIAVRTRIDDHEAAAAGVVLAHERQPRGRLVVALDDDVLQQVAETGFDRALVAAIDIHVVGHGALLPDVAVGLDEHHARRVAEIGAARRQLLERRQPRLDAASSCSRVRTSRARSSCSPRALASSDFARRAASRIVSSASCARLSASSAAVRSAATRSRLAAQIVLLDVELAERLADALVLRRRVLERVAERPSTEFSDMKTL